jgi:outer membrane protein assembly factor BamB
VIWNDQVWLTTATEDGKDMFALCVDKKSGEIVRDIRLFQNEKPRFCHATNSYASPTPVIEEGRIYIHFGSYGTACLDTKTGETLWSRRDLLCDHWRGPGSSPILFAGMLIVHFDGYDYQYVVALNKETGETVWKTDRDIDYGTDDGDFMKAYSTPIVVDVDGRPQLISPAAKATIAYDPFSGKELWKVRYEQHSAATRPIFGHGLFYINTGFPKAQLWAVRTGGEGDITDTHVQWTMTRSVPSMPSQLLIGDLLYMIHDGVATCMDAKTGNVVWTERVSGKYLASPVHVAGKIYFFDRDGKTTVIAAGREYVQLAENHLEKGFMSSPAVSGDALFLRTTTHLYRIEE